MKNLKLPIQYAYKHFIGQQIDEHGFQGAQKTP